MITRDDAVGADWYKPGDSIAPKALKLYLCEDSPLNDLEKIARLQETGLPVGQDWTVPMYFTSKSTYDNIAMLLYGYNDKKKLTPAILVNAIKLQIRD